MAEPVTIDSLMADFVCDMVVADDELSDSIFTCVDNFIDDLCLRVMEDENNIFETDRDEGDLPFNYILDKVLEKVDNIIDIASISQAEAIGKHLLDFGDEPDSQFNTTDPDYCEGINFSEITPEEFQLYISVPNVDAEADERDADYTIDDGTNVNSTYDSIFNA